METKKEGLTQGAADALVKITKEIGYLGFHGKNDISHIWKKSGSLCGLKLQLLPGDAQQTPLNGSVEFLTNHVCKKCMKSIKHNLT